MKAVFFDNDGVLVETEHLYFQATCEIFAGQGITLTEAMYAEYFLRQGKGAWFLLEQKGFSPPAIQELRQERNRLYLNRLQSEAIVIDGVESALKRLNGKAVLGIVTSSRRDHFEIMHRRTGILSYFNFTLTIDDYGKAKPDPEPYLKALEKSGLRPEACLAVEDSARGLMSACAAGLRCIVVPRGMTSQQVFPGAYRVKNTLADAVTEILQTL